jgi:hypothetical protein
MTAPVSRTVATRQTLRPAPRPQTAPRPAPPSPGAAAGLPLYTRSPEPLICTPDDPETLMSTEANASVAAPEPAPEAVQAATPTLPRSDRETPAQTDADHAAPHEATAGVEPGAEQPASPAEGGPVAAQGGAATAQGGAATAQGGPAAAEGGPATEEADAEAGEDAGAAPQAQGEAGQAEGQPGAGGGDGGPARAAGDDLPKVEFEPPPVPRFGGTEPVRVEPPPKLTAKQLRAIRVRTGLDAPEHHARIRLHLERLGQKAHREQYAIVNHVEAAAAAARMALEQRAAAIPGHVGGAIASVRAAYAGARQDVSDTAQDALDLIEESATDSDREVDESAMTSREAIQNAILASSPAVQALYEETMKPLRDLLSDTGKEMKSTADLKSALMILKGVEVMLDVGAEGSSRIRTAQNEAKAQAVPQLALQAAADLRQAGVDGAADIAAQETSLSLSFLLLVNPAAVHVEQTGTEDEETMTSQEGEVHMRIASDYERARRFVELTRDGTLQQLSQSESSAVEQLEKIGRRVEAMAQVRIENLVNGMLSGAAPNADAWRQQMARVNRLIQPGTFLDARRLEPRLSASEKQLAELAASQREDFEKQARESRAQVVDGLDQDLAGLSDFASKSSDSAWKSANEQSAAMWQIAVNFADGFRGVAQPASSAAGAYATGVEEKLGRQADDVRKQMADLLANMTSTLSQTVTRFGASLQEQIDGLEARLQAGPLDRVGTQVIDDLADRAGRAYRAMEGAGTDESALFGALRGLTPKRGAALEEYWDTNTSHGDSLQQWLKDDLSDDELSAAQNYLAGNMAAGARYEIASELHWYGDDTSDIEAALRALPPDQVETLRNDPAFKSVHDDLQSSLHGTDLSVTEALIGGRVARADALRLQEKIDRARAEGNDDALHDALSSIDPQRLPEVRREFAHLQAGGALDADATVSDEEATQAFVTYITRDVDVFVPDEGGGYTRTMRISGANRDLAVALATQGEGSPQARAARLAVEVGRGGDPRLDRLEKALNDPDLVAARARLRQLEQTANVNPHELERARADAQRAEQRRDEMQQEFARLRGADEATQHDPGRSRAFTETAIRGMFGDDSLGQELGVSMLRDGRARPALAIKYAVRGAGTDEDLIRRTLRGMRPDEVQALKDDYATLFGDGNPDALYEDLGVFGHGGFFTELSGDDRQEVEEMLLGVPQNDRDRLRLAQLKAHHQLGEGTFVSRGLFGGTAPGQAMTTTLDQLQEMVDAAGGPEHAFDANGNFVGVPGRFDATDFRVRTALVGEAAENYKHTVDSWANLITGAIALIGAIVGTIVVSVLTAGTATPLVIAAWGAGIAAATGAASMAVNYALKGGRYGWEQAGVDAALTLLDAATAGLMAGAGAKAARAAQAVKNLQMMARTPAQVAAAARVAEQQTQREFARGFVRAAITSGVSGSARTALTDGTWDQGFLTGLGRVVAGGAKSTVIGLATHGASTAFTQSGIGQKLTQSTNALRRGIGEGLSGALGGMAGRTAEVGIDVATGEHHGTWYEALGSIAQAGGRGFVENFGQGVAQARHAQREEEHARAAQAEAARPRTAAEEQAGDARFRMDALRQARAEDPHLDPRAYLKQLDEAVASDRVEMEAQRKLQRELRREALSGIPPERRGEFADVPIHVLSDAEFERFTGSQSGRAVTIFVDGEAQIIVRKSASPEVLREEGIHVLQSRDPRWRERVALLDEKNLARWPELDLETQLALYKNKVEIEIDGQERLRQGLLDEMEGASPDRQAALRRRVEAADENLGALRARLGEVDGIGPEHVAAIRAGRERRPQYLEEPPRLFGKQKRDMSAPEVNPEGDNTKVITHDDPDLDNPKTYPRSDLDWEHSTFRADYPADKFPGYKLRQVGESWGELENYTITKGPRKGQTDQRWRWYRMVEVVDDKGVVVDRRREIFQRRTPKNPYPKWQQRGSESTESGGVLEDAVRRRIMEEARQKVGGREVLPTDDEVPIGALRDRKTGRVLSAQHGGGAGFDDVVFRFRMDGGELVADIVLVEIKNYRRGLVLEDFSAVTTNLRRNLNELDDAVQRSNLPQDRIKAIREAIAERRLELEVRTSLSTGLGELGKHRYSILSALADHLVAVRSLDVVEAELKQLRAAAKGGARKSINDDLQQVDALRKRLEREFARDPFDPVKVRRAIEAVLDGTRTYDSAAAIAARRKIDLDSWTPSVGKTAVRFANEAEEKAYVQRATDLRAAKRQLARTAQVAESLALAGGPFDVVHTELSLSIDTRVVRGQGDKTLILTSPVDLVAGTGPHSVASKRLVSMLEAEVPGVVAGTTQRPSHVVWDATLAKPSEIGPVLRQVHAALQNHPEHLARLRLIVPDSVAKTPKALEGMLGLPGRLQIERHGDRYVVSFKQPPGGLGPLPPIPPAGAPPAPPSPAKTAAAKQAATQPAPAQPAPAKPAPAQPAPAKPAAATAKPAAAKPLITGANPWADPVTANAEAAAIYDRLRARKVPPSAPAPEVATVAANAGLPPEMLELVYRHVFEHEHDLATGPGHIERRRFDPDRHIGRLWDAASRGPLDEADRIVFVKLMAHEFIEASLVRMGLPYASSHPDAWQGPGDSYEPTPLRFGAHDVAPSTDPAAAPFARLRTKLGLSDQDLDLPVTPTVRDLERTLDTLIERLTAPGGPVELIVLPSGARVLQPRGEQLCAFDLFHGTSTVHEPAIRAGIRIDVNGKDPGRSMQWGRGFYLSMLAGDTTHYATDMANKAGGSALTLRFPGVPLWRLGAVLDVTQGPGQIAWKAFRDQPMMPGRRTPTMGYLWDANPAARGTFFMTFLKQQGVDPDVVIAPLDTGQTQVVIRSPRAAEILLRYIAK